MNHNSLQMWRPHKSPPEDLAEQLHQQVVIILVWWALQNVHLVI